MAFPTPKPQIDTRRAHPARVYDWLLGGKDNYEVDWEVGRQLPPFAKPSAQANRAFMHRATRWLAHQGAQPGNEGVTQFLDIGTGIPTRPNLHQIAQEIIPGARIVYADNDPIVLRHAEALLVSSPEGQTAYIHADVRDPQAILAEAGKHLDLARPIAMSLIALMHFIPDSEDPLGIVGELVGALAPGSYLVLSHGSFDHQSADEAKKFAAAYSGAKINLKARTHPEILRFFTGLTMVEPGLVPAADWKPESGAVVEAGPPGRGIPAVYAGVGRVPGRSAA